MPKPRDTVCYAFLPLFVAAFMTHATPSLAGGAKGVADPVVSWNLNEITDWDSDPVFLDVARTMRPFFAFRGDTWETVDHATLRQKGLLDRAGYATAVPDGHDGIRTIWAWDDSLGGQGRAGIYVFTYQGHGTVEVKGSATVIRQSPGRIVFDNPTGGAFWVDISSIEQGDHPRDFSIVRADKLALHEAGALFDPAWLAIIADAREVRFIGWMLTNEDAPAAFADRPRLDDATYAGRGVPLEVMIRLANEAGVDPWFTMRHDADDATIRAFATHVRDGLDPRLKAHVEHSNETWNAAFPQFQWLQDRAVAEWGIDENDWEAVFDYHVKQATRTARIWREVFGKESGTRLVTVLGTQAGNAWLTEKQIEAANWRHFEPDAFVAPADVFDEIAATTYFGGDVVGDDTLRAELLMKAKAGPARVEDWLYGLMAGEGALDDSIPAVFARLVEQKAVTAAAGLRFTAYEGGQHVHHSFAVEGLSDSEADSLTEALSDFVRSAAMGRLYSALWNRWRQIGDGPFMQFVEIGRPSRWGSWGLLANPGDRTPRGDFLLARQAEGGSWWGEGGGAQYLHGVTAGGSEAAETLVGTDEEDFLAGLGGDDLFPESGGRDGINGGEGTDTYRLVGPRAEYIIVPEGDGRRVTGANGSAYLVNVERLVFADGEALSLADQ